MSHHFRVKVVSKTTAPRPLDGPQPKRSRASRPGQQAPFNVPGQARRRGERDDNEDERAPSGFLGWGDRQGRKRDHWEARLGADVDAFLASLPGRAAQQRQERQQQLQQRQAQLASMEPLPCHLAAENGSCCELHKTGSQAAVFYGPLGVVGRLTLPVWECKTHGRPNITVHPLQISCVPTAPVNNTKLLDVELVRQFRLLQLLNGVGAHAYVQIHHLMATSLQPDYGRDLPLGDEDLAAAAHVFERWCGIAQRCICKHRHVEPMMNCLVCALSLRPSLHDGTPVPDHPRVAVMADGSAKPAKYSYTSTVQNLEGFPPWSGSYLGCTAHGVLHRFSTGDLASEAQQRYACRAAGDDGDDAGGDSAVACSSNLTCSRASASARGVVDIAGVAGVVCAHGVPLLNCFVPMPTPEQHAYHVANLVEAVQRRPDIRDIYIDIGCRVKGTLRAAFEELTQQEPPLLLPASLEKVGCRICVSLDRQLRLPSTLLTLQINIWVPWMHGFDHDLPCQLKNSGLYQEGVGRRVGEQMEHLWSRGKPLFLVARYMTPAHWWDSMNALLELLTTLLQHELPKLLSSKLEDICKSIPRFAKQLEELAVEARNDGIEDLAANLAAVDSFEDDAIRPLSTEARYAEQLVQLQCQQELRKQKDGLSLLQRGARGADMHAEGSDAKREEQLQRACVKLEHKLGISLGERWKPGDEKFVAALCEVGAKVCREEEHTIQDLVFKLKVMRQKKAHESGNAATKILRRIIPHRLKIEKHLKKHAQWLAHRDGTAEAPVTRELLDQVCKGEFPWVVGSSNATITSAHRHYAQRYRHLAAQHRRSQEEQNILLTEVILAFNWLEERETDMETRMEELRASIGTRGSSAGPEEPDVPGSSSTVVPGLAGNGAGAWHQLLAAGEAAMLEIELSRLQQIHIDARKHLNKHKPSC